MTGVKLLVLGHWSQFGFWMSSCSSLDRRLVWFLTESCFSTVQDVKVCYDNLDVLSVEDRVISAVFFYLMIQCFKPKLFSRSTKCL